MFSWNLKYRGVVLNLRIPHTPHINNIILVGITQYRLSACSIPSNAHPGPLADARVPMFLPASAYTPLGVQERWLLKLEYTPWTESTAAVYVYECHILAPSTTCCRRWSGQRWLVRRSSFLPVTRNWLSNGLAVIMTHFHPTPTLLDPNLVLGPLLIATVLNVFFYGMCVLQLCTYWTAGYRDNKFIK